MIISLNKLLNHRCENLDLLFTSVFKLVNLLNSTDFFIKNFLSISLDQISDSTLKYLNLHSLCKLLLNFQTLNFFLVFTNNFFQIHIFCLHLIVLFLNRLNSLFLSRNMEISLLFDFFCDLVNEMLTFDFISRFYFIHHLLKLFNFIAVRSDLISKCLFLSFGVLKFDLEFWDCLF